MLTSKFSTDILLIFYITCITTFDTGRCQFSRQSFDSSRLSQRTYEENRSYPHMNRRSNINTDVIHNRDVPSLDRQFNNQNRFEYDQMSRERVPQNMYNEHTRGQSEQYIQPYLSLDNNHISGTRSNSFSNADLRANTHSNNFVDMQTETSPGHITTRGRYRNDVARTFPYRRETVHLSMPYSRDDNIDLHRGRRVWANNRPTHENSPSERVLHRQPYHTSTDIQMPARPVLSRIYPAVTPSTERTNQNLARRSRSGYSPRIHAERNEVFQYRTSVRRTPQSRESGFRTSSDRERFTGYPAPSLSLPFEPLSLRYQGFRESKLAEQVRLQSEGNRSSNDRNTGQNAQSSPHFQQTQTSLVTNTENANNNITSQPKTPTNVLLSRSNTYPFEMNGVDQLNSRLRRFMPRRYTAGQNTNVADRNVADSRLIMPLSRDHLIQRNNVDKQNDLNRNNLPYVTVQDRLSQRRGPLNRHRPYEELWNSRANNIYQPNFQTGALHELFGISRTGLENALKTDVQHTDRALIARNKLPGESSVSLENRYVSQLQQADRNNQYKENLIADISKSLEIADRLNLMGLHQRSSQSSYSINNEVLNKLPNGFLPLTNIKTQNGRDDDKDLYNAEDDFIDN